MAQTKRKRRTKHRGNAAGAVEVRGRTGRASAGAQRNARSTRPGTRSSTGAARERRQARFDKAPTWRGAFLRALTASVLMVLISLVIIKKPVQAAVLFPLVLLLYVPLSYYTDLYLYRRRQRQKAKRR